jgi:hypothetical protein
MKKPVGGVYGSQPVEEQGHAGNLLWRGGRYRRLPVKQSTHQVAQWYHPV